MANNKLSMRIAAVLLSTTMLASVPLSTIYAEDEDLTNQLSGIEQQMQEAGNRKANAELRLRMCLNNCIRFRWNWIRLRLI